MMIDGSVIAASGWVPSFGRCRPDKRSALARGWVQAFRVEQHRSGSRASLLSALVGSLIGLAAGPSALAQTPPKPSDAGSDQGIVAAGVSVTAKPQAPATTRPALAPLAELEAQAKWDEAVELLRSLIANPGSDRATAAVAQWRLGECYLLMDKPEQAVAELEKVARQYPSEAATINSARLTMIDALVALGKRPEATALARQLVTDAAAGKLSDTQAAWAKAKLGRLLRQTEEEGEAITMLKAIKGLKLADPAPGFEASVALGEIYDSTGWSAEALAEVEPVVADPRADDRMRNAARVVVMNVHQFKRRLDEAIRLADGIIADHAAGKASRLQLGRALDIKGRALRRRNEFDKARAAYRQLIEAVGDAPYPYPKPEGLSYAVVGLVETVRACREEIATLKPEEKNRRDRLEAQAVEWLRAAFERAKAAGASPDQLDGLRLPIAEEFRNLGMSDRAVAWLRMGIEDPARFSEADKKLAERIGSYLNASAAEAWYEYLLDPAPHPDPTQAVAEACFGVVPPRPSSATVDSAFDRLFWLASLRDSQKRYDDAIAIYVQARTAATGPRDRARALTALAQCYLRSRAGDTRTLEEQQNRLGLAREAADQAAELWRGVVRAGTGPETHAPIESAIETYMRVMSFDRALSWAESVVREADARTTPSKAAFARFQLARVYAAHRRWQDAARSAEDVYREFAPTDRPDVFTVCALAMLQAAAFYAQAGDRTRAMAALDDLEAKWGHRMLSGEKTIRDVVAGERKRIMGPVDRGGAN
jgi:tetratricopeptide (TPR) repeat protein